MRLFSVLLVCVSLFLVPSLSGQTTCFLLPGQQTLRWMSASSPKLERELVAKCGESQRARAQCGLRQVAEFWRTDDGDAAVFEEFVLTNFAMSTPAQARNNCAMLRSKSQKIFGTNITRPF